MSFSSLSIFHIPYPGPSSASIMKSNQTLSHILAITWSDGISNVLENTISPNENNNNNEIQEMHKSKRSKSNLLHHNHKTFKHHF